MLTADVSLGLMVRLTGNGETHVAHLGEIPAERLDFVLAHLTRCDTGSARTPLLPGAELADEEEEDHVDADQVEADSDCRQRNLGRARLHPDKGLRLAMTPMY